MPKAADFDLCAFCPRLCRHVCPVAVGSGREAATPTHLMAGVWGWLQGHQSAAQAHALASLCTGCGACTAACKLERPVAALLQRAREATEATPTAITLPRLEGEGERVAVLLDDRNWAPALSQHLGQAIAWIDAPDGLGEGLLDAPAAFQRHAAALRALLGDRELIAPSIGVIRVARAAQLQWLDLSELVPAPPDRRAAPACGRGQDPLAPQPELLSCCGAAEALASAHPDIAAEVGADQAARLGTEPCWTPDARCGAWLRHHGADILDPVSWLLQAHG